MKNILRYLGIAAMLLLLVMPLASFGDDGYVADLPNAKVGEYYIQEMDLLSALPGAEIKKIEIISGAVPNGLTINNTKTLVTPILSPASPASGRQKHLPMRKQN